MGAEMRSRDDSGAALATVAVMLLVISLVITLMLRQADAVQTDAAYRAEDDELLAATEAALDRYASKLNVAPSYPYYWVDELEQARTCTSTDSMSTGQVVLPGTEWPTDCVLWEYDTTPSWARHPLFPEIDLLLQVDPPGAEGQRITVVGRSRQGHVRTLSVLLRAVSVSEFVMVIDQDLRFGSGAQMTGQIYTGGSLYWASDGSNSIESDYFAEDTIFKTVTELDGAQGYDSSGRAQYGDIREVFEAPLDFGRFWEDMGAITDLACGGGGVCLNDQATADAYLVHPYVSGGEQYLDIYWSTAHSGYVDGCSFSEDDWWERRPHDGSVTWQLWARGLPAPPNRLLWSDRHIIVGNRDSSLGRSGTVQVGGSMTFYAGSASTPQNVIVNSDIEYTEPGGIDVFGLIAADTLVINPDAHNGDGDLTLHASILGQGNPGLRTAFSCGSHGSSIRNGEFTMLGSLATRYTGWMSHAWAPRNYGYDARLLTLQPPNYPLLSKEWDIVDWSEDFTPAWAG